MHPSISNKLLFISRRLSLFAICVSFSLSCLPAGAQENPQAKKLIQESLRSGKAYTMLEELVKRAPHRLAGSPGAAAAVEWGRQKMEALGFTNVRLHPCMVPHWERGEVEDLRFAEPTDLAGTKLSIVALGGSIATPSTGVRAEIIEAKGIAHVRELGDKIKGKIVFYSEAFDSAHYDPFFAYSQAVAQRTRGASEAAKAGALAVIVRSMTGRLDDNPHTGGMSYVEGIPKIPAAAVSTLGAEKLAALLKAGIKVKLALRLDCKWHEDAPSFNVIGELEGSDPKLKNEILVVGGHLDGWDVGQGAHDDGAGVCQALESARLLQHLDMRPKRTIRVVLFMNEENGLRGAKAYYKDHLSEMEMHHFALESDRGGYSPRGFSTTARGSQFDILKKFASHLEAYGASKMRKGGGGADISPMAKSGVVLMGLYPDPQRYFDLHHSAKDTIEQVHPREINLGAATMAWMLYCVGNMEESF